MIEFHVFLADPGTMMLVSAGATLAGGGISAYGAYTGGQATKAYYDYQARIQQTLAKIAQLKANRDIMAGEVEAQKIGISTAQITGGTIARAGAANVAPTTGSTAQVYMSQLAAGREAAGIARQTAGERAYGEQVEAAAKTAGAGAMEMAGAQAATAGEIAAAGDVATSVGQAFSVASKWYPTTQPSAPSITGPTVLSTAQSYTYGG